MPLSLYEAISPVGSEILSQMMKSDSGRRSCRCRHQSQLLVSSIILDRFEWSGNWVVITPNLPSFAPHFNSCRAGSVDEHVNDNGTRTSSSWSASQCRTSSRRLKGWSIKTTTPHNNRWTNIAWILKIKRTCYLHLNYCVLLTQKNSL